MFVPEDNQLFDSIADLKVIYAHVLFKIVGNPASNVQTTIIWSDLLTLFDFTRILDH